MSLKKLKIGVIGAGVMGKALMRGLLYTGQVTAQNLWGSAKTHDSCEQVNKELGVACVTSYKNELAGTDIILLCVKPSGVKNVLKTLSANGLSDKTLVISIVSGNTIEMLEAGLKTVNPQAQNPVIRAMTNTPCMVGQAMTAICAGTHAGPEHMKLAHAIFESVGVCMELDEQHFDAVTALAGSGPAYLYLIMEALADGGVRVGLPRQAALKIVTQTVLGAASMVQQSGRHPAALRDDVTTPAGCTIGALLTMEDGKIRSVLARAVEEATQIASGLGK